MLRGLAKIFSSVLHRHLGYPKVPVLKKILYFERIKYFIFKKKFISPWRERAWKAPFLSRQCTLRLPPGRKYSKDLRENIFSSEEKYFYTCGEISLCLTNLRILEDKIKEIPIKSINHYNMIDKTEKVDFSPSKAPTTAISATN